MNRNRWLTALLICLLSGCMVGPDFRHPAPPPADALIVQDPSKPQSGIDSIDAQQFVAGMDIPAQWWKVFGSADLDSLVAQALRANPTVSAAHAALRQAQENYYAQRGTLLPEINAGYGFTRQRDAVGTLAPTLSSADPLFNLHTAQVNVSYALDLFGGNRRAAESLAAQADSQRFMLQATYLTLAANVVTTAIEAASVRAQLDATRKIVAQETESLNILRHQNQLGSIAMTDVLAQESALAAVDATLPGLEKQLDQARHALSALIGRFPGEHPDVDFELDQLHLPTQLPLIVPSELVRRRPDVLAAEAQLHAATAAVGVALADMLPQISLTGGLGGAATRLGQLFATGNTFWAGGATLSQTLFAGGSLLHHERATRAALDAAGAQYRSVVLYAFQNVADTLSALQFDAQALATATRAESAADNTLKSIRRNLELGSVGYLALLNAQQGSEQASVALAQARANRLADTAALFQSLGGGWWLAI